MEYFAIPDADANSRGLLAMNYEYPDFHILMAGDYDPATASADQKAIALSAVGIGVVEVAKGSDGKWAVQAGPTYTRRYTANSMHRAAEIGRDACRDRAGQYGAIQVVTG